MNRYTKLVTMRELRSWTSRKSTWIVLALVAAIAVLIQVVPKVIADGGPSPVEAVATSDTPAAVFEAIERADPSMTFTVTRVQDAQTVRRDVEEGTARVGVIWASPRTIVHQSGSAEGATTALARSINRYGMTEALATKGVQPGEFAELERATAPRVDSLNPERQDRLGYAFALASFAYFMILALLGTVGNQVATEKANRVTEVLLPVMPARSLLYGKVIAAVIAGVAMVAAGLVPFAIGAVVSGARIPGALGAAMVTFVPWSLTVSVMYIMGAAASAAMVDRYEDANSALMPIMFVLIGSYAFAMPMMENSGTISVVASIFPTTSAIVLPSRVAQGFASGPEIVASAVVLLVSAVATTKLATTLFGRAIRHTSGSISWRSLGQLRRGAT